MLERPFLNTDNVMLKRLFKRSCKLQKINPGSCVSVLTKSADTCEGQLGFPKNGMSLLKKGHKWGTFKSVKL